MRLETLNHIHGGHAVSSETRNFEPHPELHEKDKLLATESEEEEVTDTDIDWGDWDYVPDELCDPYYCPQRQPCFCIRGVSYTPPGWVRKYKKRTNYTVLVISP